MNHVVVWNLKKEELTDEKVESIEYSISSVILGTFKEKFSPDDFSFSFPYDPTVISDDIPVVIDVKIILDETLPGIVGIKNRLAMDIGVNFLKMMTFTKKWRKVVSVKVSVQTFCPFIRDGYYVRLRC